MPGHDDRTDPGHEPVEIAIEDLEGCPRYIGRLFRDVTVGESPAWLKARLLAAGMRPISNVVDVTNYVMLALGSPLHAFDHDTLAGGRIVVRRARPGRCSTRSTARKRQLTTEELVIADAERPVAVAGIMGGEDTEVSADTTTRCCSRLRTSSRSPSCGAASAIACAPRARRAGRRASTRARRAGRGLRHAAPGRAHAGARWTGEGETSGRGPGAAGDRLRPG